MKRNPLTATRRMILEIVNRTEKPTTREIAAHLPTNSTIRALQYHLVSLRDGGWVSQALACPAAGRASEYCWTILPAGRAVLAGQVSDSSSPSILLPTQPAARTWNSNHRSIVELLAEWKQLTTAQIWQYLHLDKDIRYTKQLLQDLQEGRLIRPMILDPSLGNRAPRYWRLRKAGADLVGQPYEKAYRVVPGPEVLAHRGLQLDVIHQVALAGWQLIRPQRITDGETNSTPQEARLTAAVLAWEGQAIERALAAGESPSSLQGRLDRWQAGQVGALVPQGVNEYVAYRPGDPAHTVLLLLHPPYAGPLFWTRPAYRRRAVTQRRI
jgi:hypothetical protein